MNMLPTKICGISEPMSLHAAVNHGARFVGFVFYPDSPRNVSIETANILARQVRTGVQAVGLFVDPTDEHLKAVTEQVPLDMIQLHGSESPGRVAAIKKNTGMQVMKAISIASETDLEQIEGFEVAADWLLFDTKVKDEKGGTGQSFDWNILKAREFKKPWMLAGGLHSENIEAALKILTPDAVDVSSGVELTKGTKDPDKIRAFLETIQTL
jgi:phosphoribosylanthranilate isomerase